MDIRIMFNTAIEITGLVLCFLSIALVCNEKRLKRSYSFFFVLYFCCIIALILFNMVAHLCLGRTGGSWALLAGGSMFMTELCAFFQALLVSLFFLQTVDPKKRLGILRIVFFIVVGIQIALLIATPFSGALYRLDDANHIHLGPLNWVTTLLSGGIILADLILLIILRKSVSRDVFRDFAIYFTIPIAGMLIQFNVPGVYVLLTSLILATMIMFLSFLRREALRVFLQEQEYERMKVQMMLSQIQPHFLYNSLGVIQELCHSDPAKAEEATQLFSQFLRRNMDSLSMKRPIPFEDELEHTKNYLTLEKMRFGDQLQVEYDIKTTDFMIPTLSLQPLVENAVRHGIRQKEEGGTITISTRETPEGIELKITDNGAGIGPEEPVGPGSKHVGLYNVSERIRRLCGGTLELDFQPGKGACAVITLPKKGGD